MGECDEWRTCTLVVGGTCCWKTSNGNDDIPLSHGDRGDGDDSALVVEHTVFVTAPDILSLI